MRLALKPSSFFGAKQTTAKQALNRLLPISPELFFVLLASLFGLIMLVVMPPYMVPDENVHLYRAYQASTGHLFSANDQGRTGGYLPADIEQASNAVTSAALKGGPEATATYKHYWLTRMDTQHTRFAPFDSTAVYSPVSYLPQIVGVTVARVIYPSNLFIFYAARLCNLAAFIVLFYLAIRLIPIGKWYLAAIGLLPMALHQAASVSSDVMNIGLPVLAIAYGIRLYFSQDKLTRKQLIIVLVLGLLLGLTKQTNALLMVPFFFIPGRLFASTSRRLLFILSVAAVTFGATIVWYLATKLMHYNFTYSGNALVDMASQIAFVAHHPVELIKVMLRTYIFNPTAIPPSPDFYGQSVIGVFSWIKYELPLAGVILAYILLAASLIYRPLKDKLDIHVTTPTRLLYLATFIGSMLAIATILYLVWTPVGAPVVSGIQGRYFLPLLPLLIPVLYTTKLRLALDHRYAIYGLVGGISAVNFVMMIVLTSRYFHV